MDTRLGHGICWVHTDYHIYQGRVIISLAVTQVSCLFSRLTSVMEMRICIDFDLHKTSTSHEPTNGKEDTVFSRSLATVRIASVDSTMYQIGRVLIPVVVILIVHASCDIIGTESKQTDSKCTTYT